MTPEERRRHEDTHRLLIAAIRQRILQRHASDRELAMMSSLLDDSFDLVTDGRGGPRRSRDVDMHALLEAMAELDQRRREWERCEAIGNGGD